MPPIPIREAQRLPDLVIGQITLPNASVELCAFPEVVAETITVTEEEPVLSLGLSPLLGSSEGRMAGDRRTPFARFGAMGFRPAGVPMEMRIEGGAFHTVRCRFAPDAIAQALGDQPLNDAQLAACFDIRSPALEDAMLRLAGEVDRPAFDTPALAAALTSTILIDLARYLSDAGHLAQRRKGGLSPRILRQVLARIDQPGTPPSIAELAQRYGLSRFHFMRCFKQSTGISAGTYIAQQRIARAKALLMIDTMSLTAIAHALGYAGLPAFSAAFRKATGRSPGTWRTFMR